MNAAKVLEAALELSPAERARVAAELIDSLDPEDDADVEAAWRAEVAHRVRELDDGSVKAVEWAEARRQIAG